MSNWNLGSEKNADGSRDVVVSFQNDDMNGHMAGKLLFKGDAYAINGSWSASGSVPGRNYSAFALWGSNGQAATVYIAAAGTMVGPGDAPKSIDLNLIRTSSATDQQYGWDGELLPM